MSHGEYRDVKRGAVDRASPSSSGLDARNELFRSGGYGRGTERLSGARSRKGEDKKGVQIRVKGKVKRQFHLRRSGVQKEFQLAIGERG